MPIINYEELEKPIKTVEDILSDYDNEEKALILKQITGRFAQANQKRNIKDTLGLVNFKDLVKKTVKDLTDGGEDGSA